MDITASRKTFNVWPILVTVLALVAIQVLLSIPIAGLQRERAFADIGMNARFSIAAIAMASWVTSATLVQSAMLVLPVRWTRHLGRDGLADPFGWATLGLTALLASSYASGVTSSLGEGAFIYTGRQVQLLATLSLIAGAAGVIAAAWIIDRFGIRRGFWVVLAASAVAELPGSMGRTWEIANAIGPLEKFAAFFPGLAVIVLACFVTLLILRQGGRMELCAWPLLLLAILGLTDYRKEMPEILVMMVPMTVLLVVFASFMLLRRAKLLGVFLPVVGCLAIMAVAELWLIGTRSAWSSPAPVYLLVVTSAVLTAFWHDWQTKSGCFSCVEAEDGA